MAQLDGSEEMETVIIELSEVRSVNNNDDETEENLLQWAAIDRLPTFERLRSSLFDEEDGKKVVDVTKLLAPERHMFIEKLIKHVENDNLRLLKKIRKRIDKVGVQLPTVEVRYTNLRVEAECEVVHGKPLPTLWNSLQSLLFNIVMVPGLKSKRAKITILNDVSGVIKPGRMTLLLGPPGCGKTTLLKALSGNLDKTLKIRGDISYNGYKLEEFVPQRTAACISQNDLHIPEMTVRETLDFSSRCQGTRSRAEIMMEVNRREKEGGIIPDPDIDTFMKAISIEGQKTTLQTNYILKILGLDICSDIMFGDAMRRGISGGQKKRLTTGEMIVSPTKAFFMDEISNGLDSSTTYQIITCLQQLAHITDASILISLLQPSPEAFNLFDDIMLMAEGMIVYHGPRSNVLKYFEGLGFKCPERKGVADFLQQVVSRKDQATYWCRTEEAYNYVSVHTLSQKFKESYLGKEINDDISKPFMRLQNHENAICFHMYSLSNWALFRTCMSREILLMKRNSFLYIYKTVQLIIIAVITMTVFLRTRLKPDIINANYYLGSLFFALVILQVDGFLESFLTVSRLPIFYKQRDMYFYPAWAYAIPASILKIPLFFRQLFLHFATHFTSVSMFRFLASVFQTIVASTAAGSISLLVLQTFGGFIISYTSMPAWLKWGFWFSPISYGEIGLAVNEFLSPRWNKVTSTNTTIGLQTLKSRGLDFEGYYYWISLGALFGFALLFNIGFILALSYFKGPGIRPIISKEKLSQEDGGEGCKRQTHNNERMKISNTNVSETYEGIYPSSYLTRKMVLPFEPLTITFQDLQYYVEPPPEMRKHGFTGKRLQLLHDITGAFRPGVLTALMGVSGAGKTTLLDVLAGRKTSGIVEGEIRIEGYPKVQDTFARISGYCEQTDVHSPQITVEESVIFSAWLRLHPDIDAKTRYKFAEEILETVELYAIKDSLVGIPGESGLSIEQRKRLTIAVEVVANPSIIFMDEPTTGLDARSSAIVMRALILLKNGGRMIYCGPLGHDSSRVIEYFESISGVPKIRDNYNPATWMLEVTSSSVEAEVGVDFGQIYSTSTLYESNKEFVSTLSKPPVGSKDLYFPTCFPQNGWGQFKACLWKQHLSYWRSPSYNVLRFMHMLFSSLIFGVLFWDQGRKIHNQQSLFNVLGSTYIAVITCGINNASSAIPYVSMERTVLYRERFSGMYASWAYALAQVTIEFPYIFVESLAFVCITYPMIGYYWSVYKVFCYFYTFLCTLMYYTYLGMLFVAVTPSIPVAAILESAFYTIFNLFAGFLIPKPEIPNWWIWLYYLTPTSWSLNAMLTSQYGDVKTEILVFEETKSVEVFLRDYFGYHHELLPLTFVILALYPILLASLFAFCISKLNFQKR
ncbi:hypothetical protein L1987_85628 [Smallanthus sonchifolius]|uniref:Uncharacterized protein n=1 Tax=Smallanthus sonchifolius TaxID=185202 RepID=A0ACB8XX21_9ASTR|nr:hypothetical protein L1987_85628 [Smallanthus sonchifolius]